MATSIRNVEKFLADRVRQSQIRDQVLEECKKAATKHGIIPAGVITNLFGPIGAEIFFEEIEGSAEHMQMGMEDIQKQRRDPDVPE